MKGARFGSATVWGAGSARLLVGAPATGEGPLDSAAVERAWMELCAANPRLHDGPILSVTRFNPDNGVIACRPDTYKRLSVQDQVPTGTVLAAVSGVLTAPDDAGREHVLLGRRHARTRMYGGMWEVAPAGGIDPDGRAELGIEELAGAVRKELREEAGIDAQLVRPRVVAMCRDDAAHSLNVVVRAELAGPIGGLHAAEREWDCEETAWVPVDAVAEFDRVNGERTIDATRALWRHLGWV